jgi:predicted NUDIX family phosphoesterase
LSGLDEIIMVLPRERLYGNLGLYAAIPISKKDLEILLAGAEPRVRREVEQDERYLQVIPYVMLSFQNSILGARRLGGGNEERLHDRYLLGFGGHVRYDGGDASPLHVIVWEACCEISAELGLDLDDPPVFTHLLVDDTNPVGRVHVGLFALVDLTARMTYQDVVKLQTPEPDKLQLFAAGNHFIEDHKDKLEGWARLALRARAELLSR